MRQWMCLISLVIILISPLALAAEKGVILSISGPIGPATQDYIQRGIAYAVAEKAQVIVLEIDTPGGLDTSMRGINQAIISAPIPVIAYVTPSGARAASAGVFIMFASHIAAMAPGTNIGAASPINLMGSEKTDGRKQMSTETKKATNDAMAYIRSLAQLRHRNANWAELAVRDAASISAAEALQLRVIDDIADNTQQLLHKVDGRNIVLQGTSTKIKTTDLTLERMSPDWQYQFLSFITNPNVAYLLMLLAMYGLFFELSNPGLVLPGVAGTIALLLSLYALQLMPINYAGLALILLGVMFMLFEVYVSSFGVIGFGGAIAFIIGSIMLFDVHDANYHLTWPLILIMSIVTIVFFFVILTLAFRSHKKAIVTGEEGLIGNIGVVLSEMNEQIAVRVLGEIWEAKSTYALKPGQKIRVTKVQGLVLLVEPLTTMQQKESGDK